MISRILTWYLMLNKRLLKKTGFMFILFMIPVFALVFHLCSKEDGGSFMRIALAVENTEDKLAVEIMEKLYDDTAVFQFTVCDSEHEAKRKVEASQADAAWVLVDHMESALKNIGQGKHGTLIKIFESEESTFLKITREKIFSTLYPYVAYYIYEDYVTNDFLPQENISEEELKAVYNVVGEQEGFIEFEYLNAKNKNIEDFNFLTSTIRGLLVTIMLLAGIASTMYYLRDEERGVYSWLAPKKRIFVSWGNNLTAMSLAGIFVTLALVLGGNYTSFWRETISMILFILMATAFCSVLGSICRSIRVLCIILPTLLVACIVFCPVFFNTHLLFQQILPPYFYLFSIHSMEYMKWMIVYCIVAYPLGYILNLRKM